MQANTQGLYQGGVEDKVGEGGTRGGVTLWPPQDMEFIRGKLEHDEAMG